MGIIKTVEDGWDCVPELKEVSDDILKINGAEGIYHYLNELLN